jgi:hypothetical protein
MASRPTTAQRKLIIRAMHDGTAADGIERQGAAFMTLQICLRRGWIAEVYLAGFGTILRTTATDLTAISEETPRSNVVS